MAFKCHSRSSEMSQFDFDFSLSSHSDYDTILYHFPHIARNWLKIVKFIYSTWTQCPIRSDPHQNFSKIFITGKTRMMWLPYANKVWYVKPVQSQQTDGQNSHINITRQHCCTGERKNGILTWSKGFRMSLLLLIKKQVMIYNKLNCVNESAISYVYICTNAKTRKTVEARKQQFTPDTISSASESSVEPVKTVSANCWDTSRPSSEQTDTLLASTGVAALPSSPACIMCTGYITATNFKDLTVLIYSVHKNDTLLYNLGCISQVKCNTYCKQT